MMKKIVLASNNKHKIKEVKDILSNYEILTLNDINYYEEIEETGETFFDNALIKASTIGEYLKNKGLEYEENLKDLYARLFEKYPNLKYAACTKRTVNSINNNSLCGYLFDGEELIVSNEYTFDILDRVGGGDAFTAGVLHGIFKNMSNEEIIEFAICASSLKHSILGDVNIIDEQTIISLMKNGLQNIKR